MTEMTPQEAWNNQSKINNTILDELNELKRKMDNLENKNKKKLINVEGKSLD